MQYVNLFMMSKGELHNLWFIFTFSHFGFLFVALWLVIGMSYMYLSVAFVQMLKASSPITTMLVMFALGMESPRADLILSILVIALGCLLSAMGELHCSGIGMYLMIYRFFLFFFWMSIICGTIRIQKM